MTTQKERVETVRLRLMFLAVGLEGDMDELAEASFLETEDFVRREVVSELRSLATGSGEALGERLCRMAEDIHHAPCLTVSKWIRLNADFLDLLLGPDSPLADPKQRSLFGR